MGLVLELLTEQMEQYLPDQAAAVVELLQVLETQTAALALAVIASFVI
jgi:hypothetical protein